MCQSTYTLQHVNLLQSPSQLTNTHIYIDRYESIQDTTKTMTSTTLLSCNSSRMTTVTTPRQPPHYMLSNKILSTGAQSRCIVATDTVGKKVVIKLPSAGQEAAMRLESSALRSLTHPRIVTLLDTLEDHGHSLVLEYAPQGDLMTFLLDKCITSSPGNSRLSETLSRTLFQQLIQALAYCTSQNILHRDIKPENIFLDSNYCIKLGDFGLASTKNATNAWAKTPVGTDGYMAPEVHKCRYGNSSSTNGVANQNEACASTASCHSEAADVWSAGVVLFIMLFGVPPFGGVDDTDWWYDKIKHNKWNQFFTTHRQIYDNQDNCSTSTYPEISDSVKDLLKQMLQVDPSKRISFSNLLKHSFFDNPTMNDLQVYVEMKQLTLPRSTSPTSVIEETATIPIHDKTPRCNIKKRSFSSTQTVAGSKINNKKDVRRRLDEIYL